MSLETSEIAALRESYTQGGLAKEELHKDPIKQFSAWLEDALQAGLKEPNAMSLATVSSGGQPSVRTVLLKGLDERGFRFFTNYRSQKGSELDMNPKAGLSFLWLELERQVNIEGVVEKVSRVESEEYFLSRPYFSQIGAWVSEEQSGVISDRSFLEERERDLVQRFPEKSGVDLPDFWGGYLLRPYRIEFWQGRVSRLHDRLSFRLQDDQSWIVERLSP